MSILEWYPEAIIWIVVLAPYYFCKSHRGPDPAVWLDPGVS